METPVAGGAAGASAGMKTCGQCHAAKPLSAFHRSPNTRDGRKSMCKICVLAWRQRRKLLPASAFAAVKEKRCSLCGEVKPAAQFYRDTALRDGLQSYCIPCGYKRMRRVHLRNTYGISPDEYAALLEAQGGVCAICGKPEPSKLGSLHVDHDHVTGQVRGLLCAGCNTGIGGFRDDAALMQAAILYVERHKGEGGQP